MDSRREALDLLRQSVAKGVDEKNLPGNPLLVDVFRKLLAEQAAYLVVMDEGDSIKLLHEAQHKLMQALQKVGDPQDPETILLAEKLILDNERTYYADTPLMKRSLDCALTEINAALTLVEKVRDPVAYKSVTDDYYQTAKNRIGGLPRDEARQFFKSHRSRLENLDKARLMGLEKTLNTVRKNNLAKASSGYIELQKNALANPKPEPDVNNNYDGPG